MSTVAELRAKIASGAIKPGPHVKGVGEGTFLCSVESAALDKGQSGNLRGCVSCKVLSGGSDKDIGGKFNIYQATFPEDYLEANIAEWLGHAKSWGISEEKIYSEVETTIDMLGNILSLVHKLALRGGLRLSVERKLSGKADAKSGKPWYFNNIKELSIVNTGTKEAPVTASAPAPATTSAPSDTRKPWNK
jgi:hypothetical protein